MSDDNSVILQYLESIERKIDALSPRIADVEKWQNNATGKISIISTVAAMLGGFVAWVGNKLFS